MSLLPPTAGKDFKVKFWGVRGSIPCPGSSTAKYGGNTTCIQVAGGSEIIIIDAGTGIRELGLELVKAGKPLKIHVLLTHTHWDHIQGFPFFTPIYFPGNEIFVYGPRALDKSLEEAIMIQMQYAFFPVRGVELAAKVHFKELDEASFPIGDVTVSTKSMNHPIRVLAYKLARNGRAALYTGDNEPYYDVLDSKTAKPDTGVRRRREFTKSCNDAVVDFVKGTNLLIADAQYTDEEYATKRGWGHSPISSVLELGAQAGVSSLALFHHEPTHDDRRLDQIEKQAKASGAKLSKAMKIFMAREGATVPV